MFRIAQLEMSIYRALRLDVHTHMYIFTYLWYVIYLYIYTWSLEHLPKFSCFRFFDRPPKNESKTCVLVSQRALQAFQSVLNKSTKVAPQVESSRRFVDRLRLFWLLFQVAHTTVLCFQLFVLCF